MALLNRLFSSRRKKGRQQHQSLSPPTSKFDGELSNVGWEPPPFGRDRIRVLVFRECEWRGRKLLFDWKSVRRIEPDQVPASTHKCKSSGRLSAATTCSSSSGPEPCLGHTEVTQNGTVYQYLRPQPDVKMLGEMIFGSVAMSYKGETMKIHSIRSPPQMMFSKVTPAPMRHRNGGAVERDLDGSGSFQNSISECILMRPKDNRGTSVAHSVPVDVPAQFLSPSSCLVSLNDDNLETITATTSSASLRSNSSFSSVMSLIAFGGGQRSPPLPSEPNGSNVNGGVSSTSLNRSGSLNSLNRRWHRTMATSIEFGLSCSRRRTLDTTDGGGSETASTEQRMSNGGSGRRSTPTSSSVSSRTKLGISIVISLPEGDEHEKHFQTFFFSHIALLESHVNKLSVDVKEAYTNRSQFVHLVVQGVERLQQALYDLYTAPRFPRPVWLNLMSVGSQHHVLCLHFITEFMTLLELHDTKDTNFFVSTLLTAVLMHHLSWVPTVTPPGILPNHSFHEKHMAKWLNILARLHPYNPLWVQLGDLYGALGFPCKMAKTVVVGSDSDLVRRLLYCLTYFIRCCEVYENVETMDASGPPKTSPFPSVGEPDVARRHLPRTFERRCSDLGPSSPTASNHLMKGETVAVAWRTLSMDVEIQEGEGDDGDEEVEDEVFLHGKEESVVTESQLRSGRRMCPVCRMKSCSCLKSHRCGVIYDDALRLEEEGGGVRGRRMMCRNGFNCSSRDSGIQSSVDLENSERPRPRETSGVGSETKRRSAPRGKVLFSIGNVPLKEMCNGHEETAEDDHVLVCTCGKHYPRVGTVFTKREPVGNDVGHFSGVGFLSSVNERLLGIEEGNATIDCRPPICDGTLSQIPSMACDSGIQSCEESSLDLLDNSSSGSRATTTTTTTIRALDVTFPEVKLEHVRNVGKSKAAVSRISRKVTASGSNQVGECGDALTSNCNDKAKLRRPWAASIDYERTNSMFDEYFDENVELNMLDEESFQETMKQRRRLATKSPQLLAATGGHDSLDSGFDGGALSLGISSKDDTPPSHEYPNDAFEKQTTVWNSVLLPGDERTEFLANAVELQLPRSIVSQPTGVASHQSDYVHSFSRSLSSNYVDRYLSDFALQGTGDQSFGRRLLDDLHVAAQNPSVLDEPVDEAVSIVASADKWTVELVSSRNGGVDESNAPIGVRVTTSQLVVGMTESLLHLWKLKMSPEFCLMHLEDRLQEFYFKSRLLADYLFEVEPTGVQAVSTALGIEASDLPLLLAIASTHSPQVTGTYELAYR